MYIAANRRIVQEVRKITKLPLCVSSVSLIDLYDASLEGVGVIKIGNYDYLYENNMSLSCSQILDLAKRAAYLFSSVDISVTIPYNLCLSNQIYSSCQLEQLGIKILQTEAIKYQAPISYSSLTEFIIKAYPTLSATYAISQAVHIPVMASSGMNLPSASLALLYGVSGIGVGISIKACVSTYEKSFYVQELIKCMKENKIISTSSYLSPM